ncbi:MAG: alpha-mannosidase [Clostridia bacterium]|nr:alpha-mannosidase [Clostridia bacterium]
MYLIDKKIQMTCDALKTLRVSPLYKIDDFLYRETGYKTSNVLPNPSTLEKFQNGVISEETHYWFYKKIEAQPSQNGKQLCLKLTDIVPYNPQAITFVNGKMVQGLDSYHDELPLEFDKENEIYIHLYTGWTTTFITFGAQLCLIDEKVEQLYYDLSVPFEAAMCLADTDENRIAILKELEIAASYIDFRSPYSKEFYDGIDKAINYLAENFYNGICGKSSSIVSCVGQTHIDVAWLWVLEQTAEKVQRSFSSVLSLMDAYPEFKFMQSQPQLYEYMKEHAPEKYEELKKRVKEGRWEAEGGMWVEADTNLTSGESLVRQLMFGKRFMKEEFGVDCKCLWLPDVFGYSAALPQIMKKCGIKSFVTSKLSWNDFNRMPYDIFMWEGIDGTEIFTYFLTAQQATKDGEGVTLTAYNGQIKPSYILGTWRRFQQKAYCSDVMLSYGWGDGGGGPTKEMLENQRRLSYGLPGFPKTQIDTLDNFISRTYNSFCENAKKLKRHPKWVGELYFEKHRGTYTSIAKIKKQNRKCEFMYQALETLSVLDSVLLNNTYEQAYINKAWKTMLLHQFHDVLPGSSIESVYERTDHDFTELMSSGQEKINEKIENLSVNVKTNGGVFVYNPNAFNSSDVVDIDGEKVYVEDIPGMGYRVVTPAANKNSVKVTNKTMENDFYLITLDDACQIISLYDKVNHREVVKPGGLFNELQVFEDYPYECDAWEINHYYKQKMWPINNVDETKIISEGARTGLKITRNYLNSQIVQTIFLYENIGRIDFDTTIDWHEEHQLLKASFPVDVHANEAVYDIQFGNISRPTHENTTWDKARFEVCAHKWADIFDGSYGMSLINDCKYGHSAEGSTLKLSLLKCATYPYENADKGVHTFKYAVYPHAGSFKEAQTAKVAQLFNKPLMAKTMAAQDGSLPDNYSLISCKNENILIDTVKKAEDSDDIIVRLYEYFDRRTKAEIAFGFNVKKAFLCDMLENNIEEISVCDNAALVDVSNYEIVTLKLILDKQES